MAEQENDPIVEKSDDETDGDDSDSGDSRVVVKFVTEFEIAAYQDEAHLLLEREELAKWNEIAEQFPGISLDRLFTSVPPETLTALEEKASRLDPGYVTRNFLTYFSIFVPEKDDANALVEMLLEDSQSNAPWVELAYVAGEPSLPALDPVNDPVNRFADDQKYLGPPYNTATPPVAAGGINVQYLWNMSKTDPSTMPAGAEGGGVDFVDLEAGWNLVHPDLIDPSVSPPIRASITPIPSTATPPVEDHGTASLGVVGALDNATGVIGIAPKVPMRVAVVSSSNIADAISASTRLRSSRWMTLPWFPSILSKPPRPNNLTSYFKLAFHGLTPNPVPRGKFFRLEIDIGF